MSGKSHPRDQRLVVLAQLGDRQALDELMRATQGWLHRYLRRLVADPDLALEVLQEVFVAIIRKLTFLHDPGLYRPWVYRIASRQALRHLRRRSRDRERELPAPDDLAAPAPRELDPSLRRELRRRVAELPPKTRAVLLLHYFEELTLRESAEILNLSTGTVKSRLAYGLERLRAQLPKELQHENS